MEISKDKPSKCRCLCFRLKPFSAPHKNQNLISTSCVHSLEFCKVVKILLSGSYMREKYFLWLAFFNPRPTIKKHSKCLLLIINTIYTPEFTLFLLKTALFMKKIALFYVVKKQIPSSSVLWWYQPRFVEVFVDREEQVRIVLDKNTVFNVKQLWNWWIRMCTICW